MNGMPYTSGYIGATMQYPIYDYINLIDYNSSNFVTTTSNILQNQIINTSNILEQHSLITENFLQNQITNTCNLIYKDGSLNTVVRISAQNPYYPVIGNSVDLRFQNVNGDCMTKVIQTGELMVYHQLSLLPAGYAAGWWNVEGKIAGLLTDSIGLRFDVTNLQMATGATSITEASTATAAVAGAGAGLAVAGSVTASSGSMIASGNIGTTALAAAGASLMGVLGYLSYQAQVSCNLSSNGFFTEASLVQSNINLANILITDNISNICIAKGFINCNIKTPQYISKINSDNINSVNLQENNVNLVSKYLTLSGGTLTGNITINTNNPTFSFGAGGMGQASANTAFSANAQTGDCIVRSQATKQLILQSGYGGGAIIISSGNNVNITNILNATILQQGGINLSTLYGYTSNYALNLNNTLTSYVNLNIANTSNYALNLNNALTSYVNTSLTNTSNYSSNINNNLLDYVNTSLTNTSNYININQINTSNFLNKQNIIIPSSGFWYDIGSGLYCYDLNIELYIKSIDVGSGFRSRNFRITTYVDKADYRTKYNLYFNNQYINFPDTLTFITNNNSNISGNSYANDLYTNGIIIGKTTDTKIGYWHLNLQNFNYIRYISTIHWDMNVIIENLNRT